MDRPLASASSPGGPAGAFPDLLVVGLPPTPRAPRRWPMRAVLGGLLVVLVLGSVWQLAPLVRRTPSTEVSLVLAGSQRGRLDADTGRFEAWPGPARLDTVSLPVATLAPGGRIPAGRTVVGVVDGGLVLRHGSLRDPVLEVFDPSTGRVVRTIGRFGSVIATGGSVVTVTLPCWAGDCPVYAVDTRTGRRAQLRPPDGTLFSGRPVPSVDGRSVAAVVRPIGSTTARLAVGPTFGALRIVEGVTAEPGTTVVWGGATAAGWVAVPAGERRVQLWHEGRAPHDVTLPEGTTVVTLVASR